MHVRHLVLVFVLSFVLLLGLALARSLGIVSLPFARSTTAPLCVSRGVELINWGSEPLVIVRPDRVPGAITRSSVTNVPVRSSRRSSSRPSYRPSTTAHKM